LCGFALILVSLTSLSEATPPDVSYYSMKLPAGVTVADLIREGYDIGHGHGSRPTVIATPSEVERLRARGVVLRTW
jgi:hypothetical protein